MMTARDRAAFLLTVLLDRLDDRGDQVRVEDVPREALFVAELCRNGFNATHAYAAAGFTGGRHNAARLWRKPRIQAALKAKLAARIMAGDEALAMLSLQARFDIRKLFPADSKIAQLPDDVALAIKSVYMTKYGQRIEFHDAQRAAELLAKAGGKLKETVKVEHTLEDILARSYRVEAQAS